MQTNENAGIYEGNNALDPTVEDGNMMQPETTEQPGRKKYHSSALYAASMWHSTVKHVKPPHTGGSFLPLQA